MFSRRAYVWSGLDGADIVPPSIDAFSPKNQDMGPETVRAILDSTGVIASASDGATPAFALADGTERRVSLPTEMLEDEPIRDGAAFAQGTGGRAHQRRGVDAFSGRKADRRSLARLSHLR